MSEDIIAERCGDLFIHKTNEPHRLADSLEIDGQT